MIIKRKNINNNKEENFEVTLQKVNDYDTTVHFDFSQQNAKMNDFVKRVLDTYRIGTITRKADNSGFVACVDFSLVNGFDVSQSECQFKAKTRNEAILVLIQQVEKSMMRHDRRADLKQPWQSAIQFESYSTQLEAVLMRYSNFNECLTKWNAVITSENKASAMQNALEWYAEEMMFNANLQVMINKLKAEMLRLHNDEKILPEFQISDDTTLEAMLKIHVHLFEHERDEIIKRLTENEPWRHSSTSAASNLNNLAESAAMSKFLRSLKELISMTNRILSCK